MAEQPSFVVLGIQVLAIDSGCDQPADLGKGIDFDEQGVWVKVGYGRCRRARRGGRRFQSSGTPLICAGGYLLAQS